MPSGGILLRQGRIPSALLLAADRRSVRRCEGVVERADSTQASDVRNSNTLGCRQVICGAIWLLWLGLMFASSRASAGSPEDVALRHAQAFNLGSNLVPISLRIAQSTHTYEMIVTETGPEAAQTSG